MATRKIKPSALGHRRNLYITPDKYTAFRDVADRLGLTWSRFVIDALDFYLDYSPKTIEIREKTGALKKK